MKNIEKKHTLYTYIFSTLWFLFVRWKGVRYFLQFRHEIQLYNMYKEIEGRHFGCIVCNRITLPLCHLGPPRHAFLLHSHVSANQQSRPHVETSRSHQKGGGRHHEQPYQWHPSYLFLSGYD